MPVKNKSQNINTLWASLIVEELHRCGADYFCVAPGSRSAPLALAVASAAKDNPDIQAIIHYDERGLGFHALGLASATRKPVVVITTSGTAVANLFPSVIEASKKKLPLIILSADRPPELRATGANQTIDQVKIFGDYVRFFFDMPCPTTEILPEKILTTIDQIVSRAKGELTGPVHLNCMLREPLASYQEMRDYSTYLKSLKHWQNSDIPYTVYAKPQTVLSPESLAEALITLKTIKNGIIIVGKIAGSKEEAPVLRLAAKLNWPIFADVTSGLRLGHKQQHIIHHFDHILSVKDVEKLPVDGILHLGGRLTSSRWLQFVKTVKPEYYVMVLRHPLRHDPHHIVSLRLQSAVGDFCDAVSGELTQRKPSDFLQHWQKADFICNQVCNDELARSQTLSEPVIAFTLTKLLPENSGLFIGNSMPIRELNLFSSGEGYHVRITANRGASGIDGNIATAAGFARGINETSTAIIGDLAFLHDLNSLSLLKSNKKPFVLIVVNNNGGAIFSFLPVSQAKNEFKKFFTTPHNMTFESAAKQFGHTYAQAKTPAEFQFTYQTAIQRQGTTVLELITNLGDTLKTHKTVQQTIEELVLKTKVL